MPTVQHHLQNASDFMVQIATDPRVIASTAITSMSMPWWWIWVKEVSDTAGLLVPILGCVLASLQIGFLISKFLRGGR